MSKEQNSNMRPETSETQQNQQNQRNQSSDAIKLKSLVEFDDDDDEEERRGSKQEGAKHNSTSQTNENQDSAENVRVPSFLDPEDDEMEDDEGIEPIEGNENPTNQTESDDLSLDRRFFIENGRLIGLKGSSQKIKKLTNQRLNSLSKKFKRNKHKSFITKSKPSTRQAQVTSVGAHQDFESDAHKHVTSLKSRHYNQHLPLASMVQKLVLNKWNPVDDDLQQQQQVKANLRKISQLRNSRNQQQKLLMQQNLMDSPLGLWGTSNPSRLPEQANWAAIRQAALPLPVAGDIFGNSAASEDSPTYSSSISAGKLNQLHHNARLVPVEIIGLDPEATRSILYNDNLFDDYSAPSSPYHQSPRANIQPEAQQSLTKLRYPFQGVDGSRSQNQTKKTDHLSAPTLPEQKVVHIHFFHDQPTRSLNNSSSQTILLDDGSRSNQNVEGVQQQDEVQQVFVNEKGEIVSAEGQRERPQVAMTSTQETEEADEQQTSRPPGPKGNEGDQQQVLQLTDQMGRPISLNGTSIDGNRNVQIIISDQNGQPIGIVPNPSNEASETGDNPQQPSKLLMVSYQPQDSNRTQLNSSQDSRSPISSDIIADPGLSPQMRPRPPQQTDRSRLNTAGYLEDLGQLISNFNRQNPNGSGREKNGNFANEAASSESLGTQTSPKQATNVGKQDVPAQSLVSSQLDKLTGRNETELKHIIQAAKNGYNLQTGFSLQPRQTLSNLVRGQMIAIPRVNVTGTLVNGTGLPPNQVQPVNLSLQHLLGQLYSPSGKLIANSGTGVDTRHSSNEQKQLLMNGHLSRFMQAHSQQQLKFKESDLKTSKAQSYQDMKPMKIGANLLTKQNQPLAGSNEMDVEYHANGLSNIALAFIFVLSFVTLTIIAGE